MIIKALCTTIIILLAVGFYIYTMFDVISDIIRYHKEDKEKRKNASYRC